MKIFHNAFPEAAPADIIAWADSCGIKVDGHSFDSARTPQLIDPMRTMIDPGVRVGTFIKPVQSGGSTTGEIVLGYWASYGHGQIQFNWPDDGVADWRWKTRISPLLDSLKTLRWAGDRFDETICFAGLINATVNVQGIVSKGALDSETIPFQLNEEVHLWPAGLLDKARRRQTLVWNSKAFDISNASNEGDQLHAAYEEGTMEVWETLCPGCKQYHEMRFRFDEKHPELGGLRFDTSSGRQANGKYNFNKLVPTIHYQMPCGFIINDTARERRLMGRYRQTNEGALAYKRSWTYEGVSVPEIKWPELVSEWLKACRAAKSGDLEPMRRFVTERECRFWSPDRIPFAAETIYSNLIKKNRAGMKNALMRCSKWDWQAGYKHKGELEHYWGQIWDVDASCNMQLIWEGKVESDIELLAEIDAHEVPHVNSWLDVTGTQMKRHLQFCYQNNLNAISLTLSRQQGFMHPDKIRRFYSPGKPIYKELNTIPVFPPIRKRNMKTGEVTEEAHPEEPRVVELYKAGLLANYFFIRNMRAEVLVQNPKATPADYIAVEIPSDVSEEFKTQIESWQVVPGHKGNAKDQSVDGFRPRSNSDHQLMNCAYQCFELEWKLHPTSEMSLLGARLAELGLPQIGETIETEATK